MAADHGVEVVIANPHVDYRSGTIDWTPRWDLAGRLERLGLVVKERIGLVAYRLTGRAVPPSPECLI